MNTLFFSTRTRPLRWELTCICDHRCRSWFMVHLYPAAVTADAGVVTLFSVGVKKHTV